jgi:hypothetical protein
MSSKDEMQCPIYIESHAQLFGIPILLSHPELPKNLGVCS